MGISLNGVGFTYLPGTPMSKEVLKSIDIELREGEVLCLVGKTGAGKSTLLSVMCGMLRPTCGAVALDGEVISDRAGMSALRTAAGVVLQYSEKQLFAETVEKDVAFGPRNRGLHGEELATAVREALMLVGLDPGGYSPRSPFSLSDGEMRRCALAGVLSMRPRYLLLDEPSSGLDLPGRELLYGALAEQRERGVGVLVVTHDWEEVELLADRVAVLSGGEVPLQGEKEEVLTAVEELEAAGLRPPPLVAVLAELRGHGIDIPACLPSPGEAAEIICRALGEAPS
ncbi:MAG: ATP-binding cassette domain-containing protein [Actinomycetota bacterium]